MQGTGRVPTRASGSATDRAGRVTAQRSTLRRCQRSAHRARVATLGQVAEYEHLLPRQQLLRRLARGLGLPRRRAGTELLLGRRRLPRPLEHSATACHDDHHDGTITCDNTARAEKEREKVVVRKRQCAHLSGGLAAEPRLAARRLLAPALAVAEALAGGGAPPRRFHRQPPRRRGRAENFLAAVRRACADNDTRVSAGFCVRRRFWLCWFLWECAPAPREAESSASAAMDS